MVNKPCICLTPKVSGVGGMVSFQRKFAAGLEERGVQVCYDLTTQSCDAALVIGGTRRLDQIWQARRRGVRMVQRLDGMNWLHRVHRPGAPAKRDLRHTLRAEYGNLILALIRARLAQRVIYQSRFSREWWERVYGPTPCKYTVIHNGVDLNIYSPEGPGERPRDRLRILMVEGSLMGGYEMGMEAAIQMARLVHAARPQGLAVELRVIGRVSDETRQRWQQQADFPLVWGGEIPSQSIPEEDRSAHILYSSDIHPACPNSVIEALACGLPVVAFDTGALPELIAGDAGRVVPYGSDAWRLEPPDTTALAQAALEVLSQPEYFRRTARQHAEEAFGLDRMVDAYLDQLLG